MKRGKPVKRVLAYYGGKVVDMSYIPDPKQRFNLGCMRIHDNSGWPGYVVEGDVVFRVERFKKTAKRVEGEERDRVLGEIAKQVDVLPKEP